MRKTLFLYLLLFASSSVYAQEFSIKAVELTNDQVILHYDLIDTTKNRTYTIFVYTSRDNFLAPLNQLTGDAGLEVRPGLNRKITWNAKAELGSTFEGDVELEIRGRVYVPFIRFQGFEDVQVRKRNVPFIVKWSGGTRQNILNFQLYQGEKLVYTFPNVANANEYKVVLPNAVRPGKDYYFRIADSKNRDQVVITSKFDVKRKIPLIVKVIPVIGVGALAYTLTSSKAASELGAPPDTPTQK